MKKNGSKDKRYRNKRYSGNKDTTKTKIKDSKMEDSDIDSRGMKSRTNDISWYNANPGLLNNSCNISFGEMMFKPINLNVNTNGKNINLNTPGIMIYDYVHGIGRCASPFDTPNVAARNIFANIRKFNSGYSNYDPTDMMIYLCAINEVYVMYSNVARALGVYNNYDVFSKYQPKLLIEALGFNYEDMIHHLPNYRTLLDSVAARINKFAVPNNVSFIARQFWMPSGIYSDSANRKAQIMAFRPAIYRVYNETSATGGKLIAQPYNYTDSDSLETYDSISLKFEDMINAITGSEDCGIISGDIRKAYDTNVWVLGAFPDNYQVLPSHDYTVLAQMENLTLTGRLSSGENDDIEYALAQINIDQVNDVDNGYITYAPQFHAYMPIKDAPNDPRTVLPVINAHTDQTDPSYVMEATRLKTVLDYGTGSLETLAMGTEFVTSAHIFSGDMRFHIASTVANVPSYSDTVHNKYSHTPWIELDVSAEADFYMEIMLLANYYVFDWAPCLTILQNKNANITECNVLCDLDNFARITVNQLRTMHDTAMLSLFNVTTTV